MKNGIVCVALLYRSTGPEINLAVLCTAAMHNIHLRLTNMEISVRKQRGREKIRQSLLIEHKWISYLASLQLCLLNGAANEKGAIFNMREGKGSSGRCDLKQWGRCVASINEVAFCRSKKWPPPTLLCFSWPWIYSYNLNARSLYELFTVTSYYSALIYME